MEAQIVGGAVGPEVDYSLDLHEGQLKLGVKYAGKGGGAGVELLLEPSYFLDKLAALIPGQIDDAVIAMLKAALGKK